MLDWLKWLIFNADFLGFEQRYWIGFLASIACFGITAYFATEVRDKPRLFTVMALFAGVWVAAASIYELPPYVGGVAPPDADKAFRLHDTAADLAAFIMVFAGALLAREGKEHWFLNSRRLQIAAMSLLGALVIPRPLHPGLGVTAEHFELVVACALGLVGFLALALGGKAIARKTKLWLLIGILVAYGVLLIVRHVELIIVVPRRPMSAFLVVSFAFAKLLLTLTFCYSVLSHRHWLSGRPRVASAIRKRRRGAQRRFGNKSEGVVVSDTVRKRA